MRIQCPHCHNPIEIVESPAPPEVVCTICGSSIRLDPDRTITLASSGRPRRLGRFELLEVVGVGAHGTVYKSRDTQLDRLVAVKVPRMSALPGQEDIDRFLRESRSTAQLKHPSIVSLYDAGQVDGTCFLVSEFVQGVTLADRLTKGRMSLRQAAELVAEIATALHYAHENGVVHRDVKPSNIMLDLQDRPHVMDFGLAKRDAGEITMTLDGQVLGTPAYMSPEQARGEAHRVDARSDVYSAGVILYELLTGELPFRGNIRMLLAQVTHDEPRPPRKLNDRIPKDLETVCLKAMAKEPGRRYSTAADFADDLRRWLDSEPVRARPVSSAYRAWRICKRNPAVAGLAFTVAMLLVALAVGTSLYALHFERMAGVERTLRKEADGARNNTVSALRREREARKDAEQARDKEARERTRAEVLATRNREGLYTARINLAQQAVKAADVAHAKELLKSQIPAAGETDLRGFEWYYLWQVCHNERQTLRIGHDPVYGIAISADGKWLAAGSGERVRLYDPVNGTPRGTYYFNTDVRTVAFSPDSRLLVAGGGSLGGTGQVQIWEIETHHLRATLTDFEDPVVAVAFAADGKSLATGTLPLASGETPLLRLFSARIHSKPSQVKIWNAENGQLLRVCDGPTGGILSLAFAPDGKSLAAGGWDAKVRLWDPSTGELQASHASMKNYVWSVAFDPHGDLVAAGGKWDGRPELRAFRPTGESTIPSSHEKGITSLAYSLDGSMLATGSWDRTAVLRDMASGEEVARLTGHPSYVTSVAFSPDGEYLASGSWDGTVKLWYTRSSLDQTTVVGWEIGGYSVSLHPTKPLLAAASSNSVSVWDLASGTTELSFPGHGQTLVAFSPDGTSMATTGIDRIIRIYDTAVWRQRRTLAGHSGTLWALAYSPDGQLLVTGSQDGTAKIWEVATGEQLDSLEGGEGGTVRSVAFSPDGQTIAAAVHVGHVEGKSRVRIWNVASRKLVRVFDAHRHNIECVSFSPDGKTFATSSHDTTAILWDTSSWQPRGTLKGHVEPIYHMNFSPDNRTLATAGWDGVIGLWNTRTCERIATLEGHFGTVWSVDFSRDGKMLASASSYQMAHETGYRRVYGIKLWHAADEKELQARSVSMPQTASWKSSFSDPGSQLEAAAFLPATRLLATGDMTGALVLWNHSHGQVQSRRDAHSDGITSLVGSPFGDILATASLDGLIKLWDMPAGRERKTLEGHPGRVDAIAFSPDGRTLLSGGVEDPRIFLWSVDSGEKLAELDAKDGISCLSFSPDGTYFVAGSWGPPRVQVWDLARREVRFQGKAHRWGVTCVAVSPDSSTVAAGGGYGDPTIRLWNANDGKEVALLAGHADEVTALAFSPDGKWLLSTSWEPQIKVWDMTSHEERGFLSGPTKAIHDLASSSREELFATASTDGTIGIWDWSSIPGAVVPTPRTANLRVPPPRPYFTVLQALHRDKKWRELSVAAEKAAKGAKGDKMIYQYLGEAYFQLKEYRQAVTAWKHHLDMCPNCRPALSQLSICLTALGEHEDAIKMMELQLGIDPDQVSVLNNLAWLYVTVPEKIRNPERAVELARRAAGLDESNWTYRNTLGVACFRQGDYDAAKEALAQAAKLNPNGATAFDLYFVAMIHQKLGEHDGAVAAFEKANAWWRQNSDLPDDWNNELKLFQNEAAELLGVPLPEPIP